MHWQQGGPTNPDFSGGVTRASLDHMLQVRGWTADEAQELFELLSRRKDQADRILADKKGQGTSESGTVEKVRVLDKAFLLTMNEIGFSKSFVDLDDKSPDGKLDLAELAKGYVWRNVFLAFCVDQSWISGGGASRSVESF
jgi:hypothetical protein